VEYYNWKLLPHLPQQGLSLGACNHVQPEDPLGLSSAKGAVKKEPPAKTPVTRTQSAQPYISGATNVCPMASVSSKSLGDSTKTSEDPLGLDMSRSYSNSESKSSTGAQASPSREEKAEEVARKVVSHMFE